MQVIKRSNFPVTDIFHVAKNERRKHMKLIKREKKRLMQRAQLQLQPTSLEKRGNLIKVKVSRVHLTKISCLQS